MRCATTFVVACLAAVLLAPTAAHADIVGGAAVTLPTMATVGQTGLAASLTLQNQNTNGDILVANTVCNAGDPAPCAVSELGIRLTPSCGLVSGGECAAGGADPGVFAISATATGRATSSCAGMVFDTAVINATLGTVRFTPRAADHVQLPAGGGVCVVEFTVDVLKSPTRDVDPATAGIQTASVTAHRQHSGGVLAAADATNQSATTVQRATPTIVTAASGTVNLGGPLVDNATVSGLVNPVAGATVTFRLYPPSAPTCAGTPVFTNTKPLTLSGTTGTATSDAYTSTLTGTHRWIATYDGDVNNAPVSGACNAANENVSVRDPLPAFPAKLEIARAVVLTSARRLDVFAPITTRASGRVNVRFQAAGRTDRFTAAVNSSEGRVEINRRIFASQARLGTGIVTLAYPGDADTQPQEVRLRAAVRPASLTAGRPRIIAGRIRASGRISGSARGVVRLQLLYEPPAQGTRTLSFKATIAGGRYSINQALPADVRAQIAARRGVVHSYTLFTGYLRARMRGEMASFQVLGQR